MMFLLKEGVDVSGIRPEIIVAIMAAFAAYANENKECVITSVRDGRHLETSLHYAGQAVDLRTRHLTSEEKANIYKRLREALTRDYDIIMESDHIHIEYQPRRR